MTSVEDDIKLVDECVLVTRGLECSVVALKYFTGILLHTLKEPTFDLPASVTDVMEQVEAAVGLVNAAEMGFGHYDTYEYHEYVRHRFLERLREAGHDIPNSAKE